jgi:UTP--glucose-1-phosphate uridylyltransferase
MPLQVNPRDSDSAPVFQLETAMGSAIECFESAGAIVVPRTRFAPVKTCNDLFVLRSDAYKVPAQHHSQSFTYCTTSLYCAQLFCTLFTCTRLACQLLPRNVDERRGTSKRA